jgi:hypothetical protein
MCIPKVRRNPNLKIVLELSSNNFEVIDPGVFLNKRSILNQDSTLNNLTTLNNVLTEFASIAPYKETRLKGIEDIRSINNQCFR